MRYGNVVGCNIPKYYLSPVISRSFHAIEGISSHFLLLPKLARSCFSTICSAYQPYSAFLIKFFTFLLLLVTSATSNLLNILSHCEMIQPRSDAMKAVKHLDPKIWHFACPRERRWCPLIVCKDVQEPIGQLKLKSNGGN